MKRLKVVLVLAVAALATMAAMSAASASATTTVLCSENIKPCPSGKVQPAGSGFGFLTKELAIVSEYSPSEGYTEKYTQLGCNSSSSNLGAFLFASTKESGDPLPAKSELVLHAGGCKTFDNQASSCVSEVSINSPSSYIYSSGKESAIVFVGNVADPLTIGVSCKTIFGTRKCNYVANNFVPLMFNTGTNEVSSEGTQMVNTTPGSNVCLNNGHVEFRYKGEFVGPWTGRVSNL